MNGVYFHFVITEHQSPFLFWSWRYLAGTVICANVSSLLSTQHGLQIYSVCLSLYHHYKFLLGWSAAPSSTVVYVSVVLRCSFYNMYSYCTKCCFWYYPFLFSLGLPCFSSSGWCFLFLCSQAETDSNQLLKVGHGLWYRSKPAAMEMVESQSVSGHFCLVCVCVSLLVEGFSFMPECPTLMFFFLGLHWKSMSLHRLFFVCKSYVPFFLPVCLVYV